MNIKKLTALLLAAACAGLMLCGCCLKHDYAEATCKEPATCTKCGKTEGEALGHDWEDADCENPKTCSRCGKTRGDALGHDWSEADCTTPATCSRCGAISGEVIGHTWTPATINDPKTCSVCGATEGEPVSLYVIDGTVPGLDYDYSQLALSPDGDIVAMAVYRDTSTLAVVTYDLEFNELSRIEVDTSDGWCYSIQDDCYMVGTGSGVYDIIIFDYNGEAICALSIEQESGYPYMLPPDKNGVVLFYNSDSYDTILCYDIYSDKEVPEDSYCGYDFLDYDEEKWGSWNEVPNMDDVFFVSTPDMNQWGFADADGNVLALYADASNFNIYGYALASDDCENYFIIDEDFNVISGDFIIEGYTCYSTLNDQLICVAGSDGSSHYYIVK